MPDLKLAGLLEALGGGAVDEAVRSFLPDGADEPRVEATRLQPPSWHWTVYASGAERVVLKVFFAQAEFELYRRTLEEYYPDRVDRPHHPLGGLLFRPDLNGLLWRFPFDPLMPSLHRAMDGGWVGEAMRRPAERPVLPELVDYSPEVGATIAYRDPERRRVVAYGKASPKATCGLVYLVMRRLWESEARRRGNLKLAKPLAFRPEVDLLLQARVYGRPVQGDRNRALFMRLADEAGRVLAHVHGADVPFGAERRHDALLERLAESLPDVGMLAPPLLQPLHRLLGHLRERAEGTDPEPPVPSHGDFKYDQFLRYRQQFVLIDFELFCQAEPALDLGTFCAYLPPSRPHDWREGAAAEVLRAAFLKSYERASGRPIAYQRLAVYEAAVLALRGVALVTRQSDDAVPRASQMLDLAFERLVAPEPTAQRLPTRR